MRALLLTGALQAAEFANGCKERLVGRGAVAQERMNVADGGYGAGAFAVSLIGDGFKQGNTVEIPESDGEAEHGGLFGRPDGLMLGAQDGDEAVAFGPVFICENGVGAAEAMLYGIAGADGFAGRSAGSGAFASVAAIGFDLSE
ncbi:MAG: hypothetical protein ACRD7E_27755 [Bryobacteraceae bacterium]